VFDFDVGHSEVELVMGVGEGCQVVVGGAGEVVAVVGVDGAGYGEGVWGVEAVGGLGFANYRKK
jgi:hypothetical protein